MPLYENVFIARQDVSSQQVDTMTEEFTKLVSDNGGEVAKTEYWGVRGLTYRIKKNRKGHYLMFNIDGPSAAVQEMERLMGLNEDILRFLTIRVAELEEAPSAQMQSRSRYDDGDRPRRDDRPSRDGNGGGEAKPAAAAATEEAVKPETEAAAPETETPEADAPEGDKT